MEKATNKNQKEKDILKDNKIEEQIVRNLGNGPVEEKFSVLLKKCIENEKETKRLNTKIKQNEKNLEIVLREKDNLQKEFNKGVLIKDKLEQVCREQQKLIKSVQNESMTKIREEEERRKENQVKFQQSINEINVTLSKNNDENNKLRDDNLDMAKKLKYLAEQYQVREQQLEKINEQVSIESQLHIAKLKKIQVESTMEKENLLRDKQKILDELLHCKKVIQEMQTHEAQLKEQVNLYTTKYDDFHNSLQKSNQIFTSYKEELEKMAKQNKKLEKENFDLKRKFERANATLIELSTEKQAKDEYVLKCTKQVQQLQKLLRTLQVERTQLHQLLKDHNIERPSVPVIPEEPELSKLPPLPAEIIQKDKMELMQKNCTELKETLAKLQGQMNAITAKHQDGKQSDSSKEHIKETIPTKKNKQKNKKAKNKGCPTAADKTPFESSSQSFNNLGNNTSSEVTTISASPSENLKLNDEVSVKIAETEICQKENIEQTIDVVEKLEGIEIVDVKTGNSNKNLSETIEINTIENLDSEIATTNDDKGVEDIQIVDVKAENSNENLSETIKINTIENLDSEIATTNDDKGVEDIQIVDVKAENSNENLSETIKINTIENLDSKIATTNDNGKGE